MISIIEEEDDGRWGESVKRFLTIDPITGFLGMMLPHGIIVSAPISTIDMRGGGNIHAVRKSIEAPHPTFHTSIPIIASPGNIKPLMFRKRYPVGLHPTLNNYI